MPSRDVKVIITNGRAMRLHFQQAYEDILQAVDRLMIEDRKRGLDPHYVEVDDQAMMEGWGLDPVTATGSVVQHKRAVDALYHKLLPAYILILGADTVFPHQRLTNPTHDADECVPSDLPYACNAPWGKKIASFRGPTRVVGRLPHKKGTPDPEYFISVLETAANWESRPPSDYAKSYFAVSATSWKNSTERSLDYIFQEHGQLRTCPPNPSPGTKWSAALLKRRAHFLNCHGAVHDPRFYGDDGLLAQLPVAHWSKWIKLKQLEGTVAAVECCYGAELYDPDFASGPGPTPDRVALCNAYLGGGAYGYLGSTTIAWGASLGSTAADVICQYFLRHALHGASTGRAMLMARLDFVETESPLNAHELKTLAQFNLLGDPSIHPVGLASAAETPPGPPEAAPAGSELVSHEVARGKRRRQLAAKGLTTLQASSYAHESKAIKAKTKIRRALRARAEHLGIQIARIRSFAVRGARLPKAAVPRLPASTRFHVATARRNASHTGARREIALVAEEADGEIVSIKELHRR